MALSPDEKLHELETIIRWDQASDTGIIYTAHKSTAILLRKMGYVLKGSTSHGWTYLLPKGAVRLKDFKQNGFNSLEK